MTAPAAAIAPLSVRFISGQPYTVLVRSASSERDYAVDWAVLADGRFTTECECEAQTFHPTKQCKHGRRAEEVIRATKEFQTMTQQPKPAPELAVVPNLVDRLTGLQKLREPFAANQIDRLPKGGAMLDYVGHAVTTARLLEADIEWNWEPVARDEHGLPLFTRNSAGAPVGLWINLTVCGITRLGYGSVVANAFDAEKQLIGDALRNAAMRFGVALDLWAKSDLYDNGQQETHREPPQRTAPRQEAPGEYSNDLKVCWKQLPGLMTAAGLARRDMLGILDGDFSESGLASYLDADPDRTIGTLISAAKAAKGAQ